MTTSIDLPFVAGGKVRDVYDAGQGRLVIVASDRLSAFDVVMAEPVPDKGRILTAMSVFWFEHLADVAPHHLLATHLDGLPPGIAGRVMVVRRAEMLPVECIVRGYLAGSAWDEYCRTGTVHGEAMPTGLRQGERLREPRFTPSTKALAGEHDRNISVAEAETLLGRSVLAEARHLSLAVYDAAASHAAEKGIIVADTKFELGWLDGRLALADEVLTPDSSRLWAAEAWQPGATTPSFDKQPVRDYLIDLGWNKAPPPPTLPPEIVAATRARYVEAYERISGLSLVDWPGS